MLIFLLSTINTAYLYYSIVFVFACLFVLFLSVYHYGRKICQRHEMMTSFILISSQEKNITLLSIFNEDIYVHSHVIIGINSNKPRKIMRKWLLLAILMDFVYSQNLFRIAILFFDFFFVVVLCTLTSIILGNKVATRKPTIRALILLLRICVLLFCNGTWADFKV